MASEDMFALRRTISALEQAHMGQSREMWMAIQRLEDKVKALEAVVMKPESPPKVRQTSITDYDIPARARVKKQHE